MTRHVVMFSGGIGSWAAARRVADQYGTTDLLLLFADTRAEDQDLYRFLDDAAQQIGAPLVRLADGRTPWQVFADENYLGNGRWAPCSRHLKQIPCQRWVQTHTSSADTTVVLGIDWTEAHRLAAVQHAYHPWPTAAPLCDPPLLDKNDLLAWARSCGLRPPRLYQLGFPHNNCGGACVRAGQANWAHLLRTFPDRYRHHEHQEQQLRDQLGKDVTILRDRRGGTSRPLTLRQLRQRLHTDHAPAASAEGDADLDWGGCGCLPAAEPAAPPEGAS